MPSDVVGMGPLKHELVDPKSSCASCGQRGTVGVTVLHSEPEEVHRYCEACWPAARARFEEENEARTLAWMKATMRAGPYDQPSKPPGTSAGSRSWHDVDVFIHRYVLQADGTPGIGQDDLAALARDIRADEAKMNGPMPERIAAFVRKYWRAAT